MLVGQEERQNWRFGGVHLLVFVFCLSFVVCWLVESRKVGWRDHSCGVLVLDEGQLLNNH